MYSAVCGLNTLLIMLKLLEEFLLFGVIVVLFAYVIYTER